MHPLTLSLICLLQATPVPPIVEGKTLLQVPGPVAPKGPDLAAGLGSDSIQISMRRSARRGNVPAVSLPAGPLEVRDTMNDIPGWKAYRVEVPPKGTIKIRLKGPHEAWFRVKAVNRWGELEQGMLQNRIPTGNPEASYINPKDGVVTMFFVVDSTEASVSGEVYSLFVTYP